MFLDVSLASKHELNSGAEVIFIPLFAQGKGRSLKNFSMAHKKYWNHFWEKPKFFQFHRQIKANEAILIEKLVNYSLKSLNMIHDGLFARIIDERIIQFWTFSFRGKWYFSLFLNVFV